jgi:hypothetical protein
MKFKLMNINLKNFPTMEDNKILEKFFLQKLRQTQ